MGVWGYAWNQLASLGKCNKYAYSNMPNFIKLVLIYQLRGILKGP